MFGEVLLVANLQAFDVAASYVGYHERRDRHELSEFLEVDPAVTPWCAAFVNKSLEMAGIPGTDSLLARSFLNYGVPTDNPQMGDLVVFKRGGPSWQGHVGFYVDEDETKIYVLGGNQGNKVSIRGYPKKDFLGYRKIVPYLP